MKLRVSFLLIAFLIQLNFYAQNVAGVHHVEKTTQNNEYLVKTSVSGLKNVDIAKLVIEVDSSHQFKKSANNPYFFDRKSNEVKFYVMGVPPSGEINLEFSIVLSKEGDFTFPVKFQYSKNEEKQQLDLPKIKISNLILLANETQNKEQEEIDKQANLKKEKQLEEEKLAKNIARFNAEQEEKKKQEEVKELAQQKAQEDKELQQKLEEEKLAKNIARFNAEQEGKKKQEELAAEKLAKTAEENQTKLEQEKLFSEQKQKEALDSKRIAEEQAQQKAKKEKELQQKLDAEKLVNEEAEKQVKLAQEKLLAEQRKQEEVDALAEKKVKEQKELQQKLDTEKIAKTEAEKQAKLLAEQRKTQETEVVAEVQKSNLKTYSVQLLSLASFSEDRLNNYCKKHNLSKDKIVKRQVGNLMKISYGKVNSQSEATILQQKLKNQHQIEASFIVVLN